MLYSYACNTSPCDEHLLLEMTLAYFCNDLNLDEAKGGKRGGTFRIERGDMGPGMLFGHKVEKLGRERST